MTDRRTKGTLVSNARWAGYAAASAATTVIGGVTTEADAAITYVPLNVAMTGAGTQVAAFAMGASASLYFRHHDTAPVGGNGQAFVAVGGGTVAGNTGGGGFWYPTNVAPPLRISGIANWLPGDTYLGTLAFNGGYGGDQFLVAGVGYVAFRFTDVAGLHYGWAQVTMGGATNNSFTINGYAYGGVGENLTVGQTPAPGCLGMLALGAVGLRGTRRKRAA